MTEDAAIAQPFGQGRSSVRSYPPSWVDRFNDWMGRLPLPGWLAYLVLLLLQWLFANAIGWLMGRTPWGAFHLPLAYAAVYNVFILAAIRYLDSVANTALDALRPALDASDAEVERWRYQLVTLPARPALTVFALAVLLGILLSLAFPATVLTGPESLLTPELAVTMAINTGWGEPVVYHLVPELAVTFALNIGLGATVLYHTIRQLRLVGHLHSQAKTVDLFQSGPLYAFSRLTAHAGVCYIVLAYYSFSLNPDFFSRSPISVGVLAVWLVLAAACFILPLLGMHRRMVKEKSRLQAEVDVRVKAAIAQLHQRVDTNGFAEASQVQGALNSLVTARDLIAKMPTWPWQPNTFRGFVSALLLPIAVWTAQKIVARLMGW